MKSRSDGIRFCAAALVVLAACSSSPPAQIPDAEPAAEPAIQGIQSFNDDEAVVYPEGQRPKRIIFFIGDGMALPAVAASSFARGVPLDMAQMPEFGLMATHEYEFVTTDSAASATAKATGEKTHFNGVSVRPGTTADEVDDPEHQLRTVVDAAQEADWRTGLVATVRINHATPAPFAAHSEHRRNYGDIARQLAESGVDVLMGAGSGYFRQRDDGRDLFEKMEGDGYVIADDADSLRQAAREATQLVGLLHERDMPWVESGEREMELAEMVEHSISVLDRDNEEGFFLMVEGAKIDWGGHRMDGDKVIAETLDMDRAVMEALSYARERDDTLVVVSSDHETGAMDVIDGPTAEALLTQLGGPQVAFDQTVPEDMDAAAAEELAIPFADFELGDAQGFGPSEAEDQSFVTSFGYFSAASRGLWNGEGRFSAIHTPHFVPIFAEGPGAAEITSVRDNADLGRQLMAWIDDVEPDVDAAGVLATEQAREEPNNVVLLVADGLGITSLTASYYHHGAPALFSMPRMGAVATHSLDSLAADRAASATALATGHRTRSGAVAMAPGQADGVLQPVSSALDEALLGGRDAALVTASPFTEPFPAALFGHSEVSADGVAIAQQWVEFLSRHSQAIRFVATGGSEALGGHHQQMLRGAEYDVIEGWGGQESGQGTPLFLEDGFVTDDATDGEDVPKLADMTKRALQELEDGAEEGFFLVVAGGPGEAKREMARGREVVDEVRAFDEAALVAAEFAEQNDDTLVLVTSTHDKTLSVQDNHYNFGGDRCAVASECGGDFEIDWLDVQSEAIRHGEGFEDTDLQGEYAPPMIGMSYTWLAQQLEQGGRGAYSPRSANFVPLFAQGAGAGQFGGFEDQPALGRWLVDWARGGATDELSSQ